MLKLSSVDRLTPRLMFGASSNLPAITRREPPAARQVVITPLQNLQVLVPRAKGRFNAGTMQESQFFRNPGVMAGVAKRLLTRHPIGSKPVQLRVHGGADNREISSLLLTLQNEHIRANRPDLKSFNDTNWQAMQPQEHDIMRQLGNQLRITSVEKHPGLVERAKAGIYEMAPMDFANINDTETASPGILDRIALNTALLEPYGTGNGHFMMASSPLLWANGDIIQGDAFADAATMPEGQAAVFSRNLMAYAARTPEMLGDYVRHIADKLLPGGVFVTGEIDACNKFTMIADPVKNALRDSGFEPVSVDEIPHIKAPAGANYIDGPVVFQKKG